MSRSAGVQGRESGNPRGVVFVPHVWETTGQGEREFDLFSRLLKDRIIFVGSEITDHIANLVVAQMLFLQTEDRKREIALYLNSPGGFVTSGLAIYDTMKFVQCDVATYCLGSASSMAAVLLAAGTKGKRFALPHSRIMIHQPWGRATGTAADIRIHAEEINRMKRRVNEILAEHSGQPVAKVEKDTDRDRYMSADEAKGYGLVDEVVQSLKVAALPKGAPAGR